MNPQHTAPPAETQTTELYYPLTCSEWLDAVRRLRPAERDVLYYLRTIDPFGKGIDIGVREIAGVLGYNPGTVSKALKVLHDREYIDAAKYMNPRIQNNVEQRIRDRLQRQLGGLCEITTPVGRIDLLTDTQVIEIKPISDWKAALGQVLTYSGFYPQHQRRIHLFYDPGNPLKQAEEIQRICAEFGVEVTLEEVQDV